MIPLHPPASIKNIISSDIFTNVNDATQRLRLVKDPFSARLRHDVPIRQREEWHVETDRWRWAKDPEKAEASTSRRHQWRLSCVMTHETPGRFTHIRRERFHLPCSY